LRGEARDGAAPASSDDPGARRWPFAARRALRHGAPRWPRGGGLSAPRGALTLAVLLALAASSRAEPHGEAAAPRPFVVADLSDRSAAGLSLTLGRTICDSCNEPKVETTSLLAFASADIAVRSGLKLWASLPVARRSSSRSEFFPARSHVAFGQLTLGLRQSWQFAGELQPRLSAGASLSATPRTGAGGEAATTMTAAQLTSGLHPSHFTVVTTTTRVHGDLAVARGPAFAQLGLALLLRAPDERELRSEVAFEAMLGVRLGAQVAVLAEVTGSILDHSLRCQSSCLAERSGFTELVAGNLGARVELGRVLAGARLVVPLTGDVEMPFTGVRERVWPALSIDAAARF
jgi:hypothetical protein